jgi:hypothetical protein
MAPDSSVSEPIDISEDASGAVLSPGAAAAQAAAAERGRVGSAGDELAPSSLDLPLAGSAGPGRYADLPPALETGSGSDGAAPVVPAAPQGWLDRAMNVKDGAGAAPVEMPAEHTEETAALPEVTEQAGVASGEAERPALEGAEDFGQDVPDLPAQKPAGQGKKLILVGIVAAGLAFGGVYLLQAKPWQTPAVPVSPTKPAVPAPTPVAPPARPKVDVPSQPAVQPTPTPAKAEPVKAAENVPAPKPAEVPAKTPPPAVGAAKPVEAAEATKPPGPAAGSVKKSTSKPASSPPSSPAPAGQAEIVYLLKVRSMPPGAQVLIDGEPMGQTPFQRRILDADKPHTVTIRKPGYLLYERSINPSGPWVKDGNTKTTNVAAKLTKSKAQSAEPPAVPGAPPAPVPDQPEKL